jgi:hypothetical protein
MTLCPVLPDRSRPKCFGLSYRAQDEYCSACPVREDCAGLCGRWDSVNSLAQLNVAAAKKLEASSALDEDGDVRYEETWKRIYSQHFGKEPYYKLIPKMVSMMTRLQTVCAKRGIDMVLYMHAQIHGLQPFLDSPRGRKIGLQPAMFFGENADRRFAKFGHAAKARYGSISAGAFGAKTPMTETVRTLTDDETAIGAYIVMSRLAGETVPVETALKFAVVSEHWQNYFQPDGRVRDTLSAAWPLPYTPGKRMLLAESARYRAAVRTVDRVSAGLSERIGYTGSFTWCALSELVARALSN